MGLPGERFNPRMYRMLLDVFRFNLFGLDLVTDSGPQRKNGAKGGPISGETGQSAGMDVGEVDEQEVSIGEYLEREGYGEGFKEDYLLVSRPAFMAHQVLTIRSR